MNSPYKTSEVLSELAEDTQPRFAYGCREVKRLPNLDETERNDWFNELDERRQNWRMR